MTASLATALAHASLDTLGPTVKVSARCGRVKSATPRASATTGLRPRVHAFVRRVGKARCVRRNAQVAPKTHATATVRARCSLGSNPMKSWSACVKACTLVRSVTRLCRKRMVLAILTPSPTASSLWQLLGRRCSSRTPASLTLQLPTGDVLPCLQAGRRMPQMWISTMLLVSLFLPGSRGLLFRTAHPPVATSLAASAARVQTPLSDTSSPWTIPEHLISSLATVPRCHGRC
mmetsp:Transcript_94937/g.163796  ORF Transcript_94937/g.163796 Transcript_94937/m.163796 type:complete len:233 (-) Transcript_94937:5622-6320(-)